MNAWYRKQWLHSFSQNYVQPKTLAIVFLLFKQRYVWLRPFVSGIRADGRSQYRLMKNV
jgi:hypothetical protein